MKKFIKNVIVALVAFTVVSCGEKDSNVNDNNQEVGVDTTENQDLNEVEEVKSVVDRSGETLEIPYEVNSIISLAPAITETLVDLGLGDKIVAVDMYSLGTAGLNEDLNGFDMMTPDFESIIAYEPDLILASGISLANSSDPFAVAKEMGVTVSYIPAANSIDDIINNVLFIGEITKTENLAEEKVVAFEKEIEQLKKDIQNLDLKPKSVYFEISPAPDLYTFGNGVFLNDIINILGGENIFSEQVSWIPITEEEIIARNPEIIFTNTYLENPVSEILSRKGWENIEAVKNDEVYYIDQKYSSQDNLNVMKAIEEMVMALQPTLRK